MYAGVGDEAYALVESHNSFGDEAINTIVQEMENNRDDVIVIFAGYPEKMKDFLEGYTKFSQYFRQIKVYYDMDPMNGY